jgi:hypothetical protein
MVYALFVTEMEDDFFLNNARIKKVIIPHKRAAIVARQILPTRY